MLILESIYTGLDGAGHGRGRLCLQPACQLLLCHGLPIAEQPQPHGSPPSPALLFFLYCRRVGEPSRADLLTRRTRAS